MFLKSQKTFLLALDPLRQISADLSKAKDVLALIQEIVLAFSDKNNIILGFQVSFVYCVCLFQYVNGQSLIEIMYKRLAKVKPLKLLPANFERFL